MATKFLCIFLYIVFIGSANGKVFEIGGRAVIGCRVSQATTSKLNMLIGKGTRQKKKKKVWKIPH